MPADPDDLDPTMDRVRTLLEQIEDGLWSLVAGAVAAGLSAAETRRRILREVRARAPRLLTAVTDALTTAFTLGHATAARDARRPDATPPDPPRSWPAVDIIRGLIQQAPSVAAVLHQRANDDVAAAIDAGTYPNRRAAAADLLQRYAAQGLRGFTDSAGRSWDLVSYAEVVTRTAATQTMIEAHAVQLQTTGNDLVIVSDSPGECERCRPYEGQVLSISGRYKGTVTVDGHKVTVFDSVAGARAGGVWHPNCRHRMGLYLPGITPPLRHPTADPAGDRLRQQQRARERRVRDHKRRVLVAERAAGADSPQAVAARVKLRAYQQEFAAWRKANDRKNLTARTSLQVR